MARTRRRVLAAALLLATWTWIGTGDTLATGLIRAGLRVELVRDALALPVTIGASSRSDMSADGRFVLFVSTVNEFATGDNNDVADVLVRDRLTGTVERVSVGSAPANTEGNNASFGGGISPDGRFVVFSSLASNLVAGDTNNVQDVFVRDRLNKTTELVSVSSAPASTRANGESSTAQGISANGRFVVFTSAASNLVAGDSNSVTDIFVRDRESGTTERVSVTSAGGQADRASAHGTISGDGRFVAFESIATNLVPSDTNLSSDIFLRDRQTGATTRISVSSAGAQATGHSDRPEMSDNGGFVVFLSEAANLVQGDGNAARDVFLRHLGPGVTERVSVASSGREGNGPSDGTPAIDADGSTIAFASRATDLVAGDTRGEQDVFVRDRLVGTTTRVSESALGQEGNVGSLRPGISGDGRFIVFTTNANNLVPGRAPNGVSIAVAWHVTPSPSRIAVFRPPTRDWLVRDDDGSPAVVRFSADEDIPVPADYRGLGRAQIAVFRPSIQVWFVRVDATTTDSVKLGDAPTNIPVPADYLGQGRAQFTVYRPDRGSWLIHQGQSDGQDLTVRWGTAGDVPVPGDYDGDGRDNIAVFRPRTREWFIRGHGEGTGVTIPFGGPDDVPVPGDYDGDGRIDVAVFRPGTREWFIRRDSAATRVQFGGPGDIPVPADYLEAGKTEIAVYRPSTGSWFIRQGFDAIQVDWGGSGDLPLPAPFGGTNP